MKKLVLSLAAVAMMTVGLSSCKKCQDCTGFGAAVTICEKDYADKETYDAVISAYELAGGECK